MRAALALTLFIVADNAVAGPRFAAYPTLIFGVAFAVLCMLPFALAALVARMLGVTASRSLLVFGSLTVALIALFTNIRFGLLCGLLFLLAVPSCWKIMTFAMWLRSRFRA
jgi:hypothetical protein